MRLFNTLRRIRACESEAAAQLLLEKYVEQEVLDEREACAKIAEKYEPDEKLDYVTYASRDIRLR